MRKLSLIALSRAEVDARVGAVAAHGSDVRAVLPHALLAAMKATHRLFEQQTQGLPRAAAASSAVKVSSLFLRASMPTPLSR